MTLTVLLDLDDTLLDNKIDTFLPAYLKALGEYVARQGVTGPFIELLLAATRRMVRNTLPTRTLQQTFEEAFYPALGQPENQVRPILEDFYAQVFPTLRSLTRPNPLAAALVQAALRCGYRLVIATNPLFPRTAILQRLEWAGLPAGEFPFEIITSFETFHFSKEQPAYYAEILARLGWPEEPVVMVGNDPDTDIEPARQLGLATYWVNESSQAQPFAAPHGAGPLGAALDWIQAQDPAMLTPHFKGWASSVAALQATPAALDIVLRGLPPEHWARRPLPEEWALVEIICHLRDVDREVNLPRLEILQREANPVITAAITDPWAIERNYLAQDGAHALQTFFAARLELLALVERLGIESRSRPARHTIFGPTTTEEILEITAGHDRLHVAQVLKTLA